MKSVILSIILLVSCSNSYMHPTPFQRSKLSPSKTSLFAKGFGASPPTPRPKSAGQERRESEASRYDDISSSGGQEYNIFCREFGSSETSWLPCGSIAVPRGEQVAKAIYSNEDGVKAGVLRLFPMFKGKEDEIEFGFNLKVYPDDPIEMAVKPGGEMKGGLGGIGKWIGEVLNPVDTSGVGK